VNHWTNINCKNRYKLNTRHKELTQITSNNDGDDGSIETAIITNNEHTKETKKRKEMLDRGNKQ
jgi:hypothetical protein